MLQVFPICFILASWNSVQANYTGKIIMEGVEFGNVRFIKTSPEELTFNSQFFSIILELVNHFH